MLKHVLLTSLLLAVAPVFGQTPDAQWTDGLFNGRWWQEHSDVMQRHAYLAGMLQGLGSAQPESKLYGLVAPDGLTYGELIKAVDAIYREPLNGRIPVIDVLQIVKAKAAGKDPEAVEVLTRYWRKYYAGVKPATPEVTKQ